MTAFVIPYFFIFVFFSLIGQNKRLVNIFLCAGCIALAIWAGSRSTEWPDTENYIRSFRLYTPALDDLKFPSSRLCYREWGFYLLSSAIKSISESWRFYLVAVASLSVFLLYKNLKFYSPLPLVGLMVYVARFFFTRDMMQIRASLAIMIVIFAIRFVAEQNLRKYLLFMALAACVHVSSLLAIPLYWMPKLKLTKKWICIILLVSFALAYAITPLIRGYMSMLSIAYDFEAYTMEGSSYSIGKGLLNPMIYYQVALLLLYTFWQRRIVKCVSLSYYEIIRVAYLYSTVLLILFSSFADLSGRTSTIFATLEVAVIPSLVLSFRPNYRIISYLGGVLIMTAFFYMKLVEVVKSF